MNFFKSGFSKLYENNSYQVLHNFTFGLYKNYSIRNRAVKQKRKLKLQLSVYAYDFQKYNFNFGFQISFAI